MNTTEKSTLDVLKEMAVEDTGRALCDSGDAYGRNYQRNRENGVTEQPEADVECFIWTDKDGQTNADLSVTLNVVPWLEGCLEYDAELDAAFQKFAEQPEWEHEGWLEVVEAWIETLDNLERGQGFEQWINTYNGEDALSQVVQYRPFTIETDNYYDYFSHVALQIHGGCDVRGGYTTPRIFRAFSECYTIMDNARVSIGCCNGYTPANVSDDQITLDGSEPTRHCGAHWTSYNAGYEWESYDSNGSSADHDFAAYETKVVPYTPDMTGEAGVILVAQNPDDHYRATKIFCPVCGVGELCAYPY